MNGSQGMFSRGTDREWERFGKRDAYYGVISHAKYRKENMSPERREEFFRSGDEHIARVLANVRVHLDPEFAMDRALDFGCGVGRLTLPLANHAREVTGLDVSESMLREAERNAGERAIANVTWAKSDDSLSALSGMYDFVHSYIVFQHIPVARGERLFRQLLNHLANGGVGAIHFAYASSKTGKRFTLFVQKHIPGAGKLANCLRGRGLFEPQMQMNTYSLGRLFALLQQAGIRNCYTELTDHSGELGAVIYFRK